MAYDAVRPGRVGRIDADVKRTFRELGELRNKASHYDSRLALEGTDARAVVLEAVTLAQSIISSIFAPHGGPPVYIADVVGQSFIVKDREADPLIKHFFIAASVLVSPDHGWRHVGDGAGVTLDDETYHLRYPHLWMQNSRTTSPANVISPGGRHNSGDHSE